MPTITVIDKPSPQTIQTSNSSSSRDKAIATLLGNSSNPTGNAQATSVSDPSNVAVEDLQTRQNDTVVDPTQTSTEEVTQTAATTTETEEEAPTPLSTQYAILARKEKALRAKAIATEQSLKAREAALTAREAEIQSKSNQDLSNYISKDKLRQNAFGTLTELGLTYDDISQQALAAQSPDAQAIRQIREEVAEELKTLREEQAKTRQTFEQQQAESYKQAVNQIRIETRQLVNADPSYETVKAANAINDVVELIERTFKEDGTLLTVEQAAQAVEEHLVEEAFKFSQLGKIQERLKKASATTQTVPKAQSQATQQVQIKTLTNAVGSTRPLSARERALLAFKGELTQK